MKKPMAPPILVPAEAPAVTLGQTRVGVVDQGMGECTTCKGKKVVNKKVWTQDEPVKGVHPAINARRPAYRTIVQVPCPDCGKAKS